MWPITLVLCVFELIHWISGDLQSLEPIDGLGSIASAQGGLQEYPNEKGPVEAPKPYIKETGLKVEGCRSPTCLAPKGNCGLYSNHKSKNCYIQDMYGRHVETPDNINRVPLAGELCKKVECEVANMKKVIRNKMEDIKNRSPCPGDRWEPNNCETRIDPGDRNENAGIAGIRMCVEQVKPDEYTVPIPTTIHEAKEMVAREIYEEGIIEKISTCNCAITPPVEKRPAPCENGIMENRYHGSDFTINFNKRTGSGPNCCVGDGEFEVRMCGDRIGTNCYNIDLEELQSLKKAMNNPIGVIKLGQGTIAGVIGNFIEDGKTMYRANPLMTEVCRNYLFFHVEDLLFYFPIKDVENLYPILGTSFKMVFRTPDDRISRAIRRSQAAKKDKDDGSKSRSPIAFMISAEKSGGRFEYNIGHTQGFPVKKAPSPDDKNIGVTVQLDPEDMVRPKEVMGTYARQILLRPGEKSFENCQGTVVVVPHVTKSKVTTPTLFQETGTIFSTYADSPRHNVGVRLDRSAVFFLHMLAKSGKLDIVVAEERPDDFETVQIQTITNKQYTCRYRKLRTGEIERGWTDEGRELPDKVPTGSYQVLIGNCDECFVAETKETMDTVLAMIKTQQLQMVYSGSDVEMKGEVVIPNFKDKFYIGPDGIHRCDGNLIFENTGRSDSIKFLLGPDEYTWALSQSFCGSAEACGKVSEQAATCGLYPSIFCKEVKEAEVRFQTYAPDVFIIRSTLVDGVLRFSCHVELRDAKGECYVSEMKAVRLIVQRDEVIGQATIRTKSQFSKPQVQDKTLKLLSCTGKLLSSLVDQGILPKDLFTRT